MEPSWTQLQPQPLWRYFFEICGIPHGTYNEAALRDHVARLARERGLTTVVDDFGNLLVRKPASPGRESAPGIILQAHLDMVCEKNRDAAFDFAREGIRPVVAGEWLRADGTTLGADNGIGVAAMLAVMTADDLTHGPLEFLFTVQEEVGVLGAFAVKGDLLRGTYLLNLDGSPAGVFVIGCAGGGDTVLRLPLSLRAAPDRPFFRLGVSGLKGGHSGIDIHLGRGNANKILAAVLQTVRSAMPLTLAEMRGGDKRNAIARDAEAVLAVPAERREDLRRLVQEQEAVLRRQLQPVDDGVRLTLEEAVPTPASVLSDDAADGLLALLAALPHGVLDMSRVIPGLVETSTNLAALRTKPHFAEILYMTRSSSVWGMEQALRTLAALGELSGAAVDQPPAYPGWRPDPSSRLLQVLQRVYGELFGAEPQVQALHAGLEAGVLLAKYPAMEAVAFGCTILDAHSPTERVEIVSVQRMWDLLVQGLQALAG